MRDIDDLSDMAKLEGLFAADEDDARRRALEDGFEPGAEGLQGERFPIEKRGSVAAHGDYDGADRTWFRSGPRRPDWPHGEPCGGTSASRPREVRERPL